MAMVKFEMEGVEELLKRLEAAGKDARRITEDVMEETGRTISQDTYKALQSQNLPARGTHSTGKTMQSVLQDQKTSWDVDTAWIPIGFNFSLPGAGGFLISGTPRMAPDPALRKMYKQKGYMNKLQKKLMEELWKELNNDLGG